MKFFTCLFIAFLFPLCFLAQRSSYRSKLANSALIDLGLIAPTVHTGLGMDIAGFSPAINLLPRRSKQRIKLRAGGDFYFYGLGHKNLEHVPLTYPQQGDASVSIQNEAIGLNLCARITFPNKSFITPYADVFAGTRYYNSNMRIAPYQHQPGYQSATFKDLIGSNQWNGGITAGLMFSLGDNVKLNAGCMYAFSQMNGNLVDLNSTHLESGSIVAGKMPIPNGTFSAKLGFTFYLYDPYSTGSSSRYHHHHCHSSGWWLDLGGALLENAVDVILK